MTQGPSNTPKPVISWPGGKRLLAKHILPLMPAHQCYIEVFGGGLAVLCQKPRSPLEVVNDIDEDLVRFYRVVRFHPEALLQELEFLPASRQEFMDFRVHPGTTDVQRAARWWYLNVNSFGGFGESFPATRKSGGATLASRSARLDSIRLLNMRLDRVAIEHLDWRKCLQKYDDKGSCFYLDPPYVAGSQNLYAQKFSERDHAELADAIRSLKGRWVLSYCDSPLVRKLYAGCKIKEVSRARGIGNNHGRKMKPFKELIIAK